MLRKIAVAFTLVFLLPVLALSQDGKLRGKVADKESGDPLIGANVVIEGTSLGASSDVNGEYVILSVPPGVYTIKATYIGYSAVTINNIRVSSNITLTQDFSLSSTAVQGQEVVVTAERPLIQRNTTNAVRLSTQEEIKTLPIRGLQNMIALEAGVVQQNGNLFVRGGRAGEVAFFVDGANATNPLTRGEFVTANQEAIEEFQLQAGGFTAEQGGASSGIVRTTIRTGGTDYRATVDYQTDDFAKPGQQFLKTSSFGFRNAVFTIGGPMGSDAFRFFVSGQHNYNRMRQNMWLEPFTFSGLTTDNLGTGRLAGVALPGDVNVQRNFLYHDWDETNTLIGTLLFDFNPIKVKLTGNYSAFSQPNGGAWPGGLQNIFTAPDKYTLTDRNTTFLNARVTHLLNSSTFYEVGLSYQRVFQTTYDQDFKEDWQLYPDSAANFAKYGVDPTTGSSTWRDRYAGPYNYSTIYNFVFAHPYAPNNAYNKGVTQQMGVTFDFTSQVNSRWEVKAGGSLESWNFRTYTVGNIAGYLTYMDPNRDGVFETTFPNDYERRVKLIRAGGINNIGYDIDGNETSDGLDKPRTPQFASAYVQNKFEYNDLILNIGARFEYMDPKIVSIPSDQDVSAPNMDPTLQVLQESELVDVPPTSLVLPRINFSFPVSERTVFYSLYGKFAQMPRLDQLYINNVTLSGLVNPTTRTPYNLGGNAVPFTAKPERNTQFEIGIRQSLSDNFALQVNGFYKDESDKLALARQYSATGTPIYVGFANSDFGTIKGLELTLELRRTNRIQAKLNYTLSDARGTGSSARTSQQSVTDDLQARAPNFITALSFNQTHKGSVMVDYRFAKGDGGMIFEGFGANVIMNFNSGHNYTRIKEPKDLGQATPWNIGVRALADSRNRNPVEPVNASTTPFFYNFDLALSKSFFIGSATMELYVNVLNLLNTKQILNVYPQNGTTTDDGWLKSPFSKSYQQFANYTDFYRAINLDNRFSYISTVGGLGDQTGNDLYGVPRRIRVGLRVEI